MNITRTSLPLLLCCLLTTPAIPAEPQTQPPSASCTPLSSLGDLGETHRIVLLGETHGTKEIPKFFFDVVCTAAMTLPPDQAIVVGLEYYAGDNDRLQVYLHSDGSKDAVRALLQGEHWNTPLKDGRTSIAMLELIDKLRRLTQDKKNVSVLAFDPLWPYPAGVSRDQGMANLIEQAVAGQSSVILIGLVGDYHARIDDGERKSLATNLKSAFRSYRFVFSTGSYWVCDGPQGEPSCGVKNIEETAGYSNQITRALSVSNSEPSYHGVINLVRVSASEPAQLP